MGNVNKQLLDVAEKLKKAGATVPAPQTGGTIESAMRHGLSIALAVVEQAIAAAEQAQPFVWWSDASREVWMALEAGRELKHDERGAYLSSVEISGAIPLYTKPPAQPVARDEPVKLDDDDIISIADANGFDISTPDGVIELCKAVASHTAQPVALRSVTNISMETVGGSHRVVLQVGTLGEMYELSKAMQAAAQQGEPVAWDVLNDDLPDVVIQATAEAIGDAYDCVRVWEAWSVGTMTSDDFLPVADDGDRVAEIARAAIAAWHSSTAKPSDKQQANRECGCGWHGAVDDCTWLGSVGPLCPNCHETTEEAAQPPAVAVPDGWRDAMERAAEDLEDNNCLESAHQLRAMLAAAPQATAEDSSVVRKAVAVQAALPPYDVFSNDDGDSWETHPASDNFVHGLQLGEEFELLAGWQAERVTFRVTKVPDDESDDYEVEEVTAPAAAQKGSTS